MNGARPGHPLVSVIINNYNYGRFLRDAIESALNQSYPSVEVIVVDDGSTDSSREIITGYVGQGRVRSVLKENGGQASAFNAGFAVSKGDIIIFLDADDVLLPQAVEEVVKVWEAKLSKVQWRLQLVTERLQPLPATWPGETCMPSGNLRESVLRWRYYPSPPTSGNAFSRWLLERILPMPELEWRIAADSYLLSLAAIYGEVRSIDKVLGYYRVHGGNVWYSGGQDVQKLIQQVRVGKAQRQLLKQAAHALGLEFKDTLTPTGAKVELASAVLTPGELKTLGLSPSRLKIALRGLHSSIVYPYMPSFWARMRLIAWFLLAATLPRGVARRVAVLGVFPASRPAWLARLLRAAHKLSAGGEPRGF